MRAPIPIARGQGNRDFRTTEVRGAPVRRGQVNPYDVNGSPSGGSTSAESVSFTPAGSIAATDVQAAIEELDTEKAAASHTHAISNVTGLQAALDAKLAWVSVPASASATGTAGQVAYDAGFFYVCVATDTWVRAALATW